MLHLEMLHNFLHAFFWCDLINHWKACFVEVSEKEYFLGFLLNKCTQVVQIEIIQMIRRVLLLLSDGAPEQHNAIER